MITIEKNRIDEKAINLLAKQYNVLDYHVKLSTHLKTIFPKNCFNNFSKYELYKILNKTLIENYHGEEALKRKELPQLSKLKLITAEWIF
jgi:hypothetical protein